MFQTDKQSVGGPGNNNISSLVTLLLRLQTSIYISIFYNYCKIIQIKILTLTGFSWEPLPRIDLRIVAKSSNIEARLVREWWFSLSCCTLSIPLDGVNACANFFISTIFYLLMALHVIHRILNNSRNIPHKYGWIGFSYISNFI